MRRMGIREIKDHLSEVVEQVEQTGEAVEVTRHGLVVARIVPAGARAEDRDANGTWTALNDLRVEINAKWPKGVSAKAALDDARG